ncbi:3D domain-containing protein [Desulforhopalus singaporensis]|nr:3D domain-containing protein [Desulforhopalus singaporensis]
MALLLLITAASLATGGCAASSTTRIIEATAYCNCSKCCEWERGNATYLKLDFWNKYQSSGPDKGRPYSGLTANGSVPREPEEGFFSVDSIRRPWMIPFRLLLFPWYFLPHDGTLAADTSYYPFGTRIHVPGYGWGVVQDRGGAIKGPDRLDLYFHSHHAALEWGRKKVRVTIVFP